MPITLRNRPRIPTPEASKESPAPLAVGVQNVGVLMGHAYGTGAEAPVLGALVLSPIEELDGGGSVNNTLHAGAPGTAALARAVRPVPSAPSTPRAERQPADGEQGDPADRLSDHSSDANKRGEVYV